MNYDRRTLNLLELIFTYNSFRVFIEMFDYKSMALRIYSFTSTVKKRLDMFKFKNLQLQISSIHMPLPED